ncbi:helix-hairpin-helix domain-containing protein [Haloprofundus salinisoli]|uniref:helix-hairpin-helix domain-containing protein n=1 Tax=Haloprofundus salinisoli TaxID=2876193 RepID=UPI001CCC52AB|nr:helix-hairpin-helix domain-containing protein [Haloprofundus salinisoli]
MALLDKLKSLLGLNGSTDERERDPSVTVERDTRTEASTETEAAVKGTDEADESTEFAAGSAAAGSTEPLVDEDVHESQSDSLANQNASRSGDADGPDAAEPAEAAGPESDEMDTDLETELDESGESDETVVEDTDEPVVEEAEPITEAEVDDEGAESVAEETEAAASTGSMVDEDAEDETAAEPPEAAGPESGEIEADVEDVGPGEDEDLDAEHADEAVFDSDESETDETEVGADEPTTGSTDAADTIKGIGPAYAQRLADVGIETVADLADADAADLGEKIDVSEKRVDTWIARAREQ